MDSSLKNLRVDIQKYSNLIDAQRKEKNRKIRILREIPIKKRRLSIFENFKSLEKKEKLDLSVKEFRIIETCFSSLVNKDFVDNKVGSEGPEAGPQALQKEVRQQLEVVRTWIEDKKKETTHSEIENSNSQINNDGVDDLESLRGNLMECVEEYEESEGAEKNNCAENIIKALQRLKKENASSLCTNGINRIIFCLNDFCALVNKTPHKQKDVLELQNRAEEIITFLNKILDEKKSAWKGRMNSIEQKMNELEDYFDKKRKALNNALDKDNDISKMLDGIQDRIDKVNSKQKGHESNSPCQYFGLAILLVGGGVILTALARRYGSKLSTPQFSVFSRA